MPSSSLFLRSCTTLFLVLSLVSVPVRAALSYTLSKEYSGTTFFDEWDFFTDADPNKGFVTYVDRNTAFRSGLAGSSNGDAFMRVDSTNRYDPNSPYQGNNGYGRPSVRIMTQQSFYHGLIIAEIKHMPWGCGTWPAFWALGAQGNWPNSGEIDIVEGINNRINSLSALHTGGQCRIAGDPNQMTGSLQNNDCFYDVQTGQGAVGCAILDTDSESYGSGLNFVGGEVFAMDWQSDAIRIWSFPPGKVPLDIERGTPDPSGWGLPAQIFNGPDCVLDDVIKPQKLIFNTNFCGDFANAFWQSEGCASQTGYNTCAEYVANTPSAFTEAYWQIGSLKYYQKAAVIISTTSSATTTTATSVSSPTPSDIPTASTTTPTTAQTSVGQSTIGTSTGQPQSLSPIIQQGSTTTTSLYLVLPTTVRLSQSTSTLATTTVPLGITISTLSGVSPISYSVAPVLTANPTTPIAVTFSPILTNPVIVSPTSISGWQNLAATTVLASGVPEGRFYLPPLGAGVPITPGWNSPRPASAWNNWQPIIPTGAVALVGPNQWVDLPGHEITITVTKTWIVPCETGYETMTTYLTTKHCGCTETPIPTIPMKVVVTTCPEEWGFKTLLTITVPHTLPLPVPVTVTQPAMTAATWAAIIPPPKDTTAKASPTWNSWSTYKTGSMVMSSVQPTWATIAIPVVPTPAPAPTPTWSDVGVSGGKEPKIAKWQGAASKTSIGAGFIGLVVAVIAFVL